MKVKEIMTPGVAFFRFDDPIKQVARKMEELNSVVVNRDREGG